MESIDNKNSKYYKNGINKNTYDMLFPDFYDTENEKIDKKSGLIIQLIEVYTLIQQKEIFADLVKNTFKEKYDIDFSNIKYNEETKQHEYKVDGKIYTFNELSDITDIEKFKKELKTDKRHHKCHTRTLELSFGVPESNIVTGYEVIADIKVLHSILEYKVKNKLYIIDYTKNIIMPKEQYMELTKFKEIERISDLEYIEDLGRIYNFPHLTDKVYVTFQKELIRELKSKALFEDDEISKKEIQELKEGKMRQIEKYKESNEGR